MNKIGEFSLRSKTWGKHTKLKMKLNLLDTVLKSTVKFMLPADCPDEIIDFHYTFVRNNIISNTSKLKNKVKSIIKIKK